MTKPEIVVALSQIVAMLQISDVDDVWDDKTIMHYAKDILKRSAEEVGIDLNGVFESDAKK